MDCRCWVTIYFNATNGKAISSKESRGSFSANPIPYVTARISDSQFAYTFQVSHCQKFIPRHFYPASYPGFERTKAFFTVKAGAYTPLNNFSASLTADALAFKSFTKEFCVNVEENQALSITFVPSESSTSNSVYALLDIFKILMVLMVLFLSFLKSFLVPLECSFFVCEFCPTLIR